MLVPLGEYPPQVDGAVQIKSYLVGNPPIKIKLNDDLVIGKRDNPYGGAAESGETDQDRRASSGGPLEGPAALGH